jgi:hypothetical protein
MMTYFEKEVELKRNIYTLQGVYYIVTGFWPLLSMRSFEAISGKKVDKWLVRMVGLLTCNIGVALIENNGKNRAENIRRLAIGSAISYMIIDVYYSLKNRISKIYLMDAIVEFVVIAAIIVPGIRLPGFLGEDN